MRKGAEYFTAPTGAAQRRYEALRAYFLDEMPAVEVAERFGYSTASIHQMANLLRKGKLTFFAESRPGPKGPRKATETLRGRALELRTAGHSVTEIAAALTREGMPISAQTVWQILNTEGLPRLPRRNEGRRGPPPRPVPGHATALNGWPTGTASIPCDYAGLMLLLPAMARIGLPELIGQAGYPSTSTVSAWHAMGVLLLAKCARRDSAHHPVTLIHDEGLAFALGITTFPEFADLGAYSWRVRRDCNQKLLAGLTNALRPLGMATGAAGFNCDFRAVRSRGGQAGAESRHASGQPQNARAALTFFAQDHSSAEMVYSNADITKAEQASEIVAFVDYWSNTTGSSPALLVFDSQLTTYKILSQLTSRGVRWLALRQRGKAELARLAMLPRSEWEAVTATQPGGLSQPRLHEDMIKLSGIGSEVRQIAVTSVGRDDVVLLITNDLATAGQDLFARYDERMTNENELDAHVGGFQRDAVTSLIPLNVDLDTTLTVVAGNLNRLLALELPGYDTATYGTLWRNFLDVSGTLHVTQDAVTCALQAHSHAAVLIDAGFGELQAPIPWWGGRTLRFRIPGR
ncbi:MAG TPA: hypothetical protein VF070_16175 [Streptosporangiaceae bacterium]